MVVLALVLLAGCGKTDAEAPPVADSTMVAVLASLHLVDARAQFGSSTIPSLRDSVFARYGVDSARYARALAYYAERPAAYAALYNQVVDRLNAERSPLLEVPR